MIECINISKRFKNNKVLSNINLSLPKTGLISIVGESGSGKSTLLNIIGGLCDEYSGSVLYKGKDIRTFFSHYKRNRTFIFQDIYLIMWLNIKNNISISRYFYNGYFNLELLKEDINVVKMAHLSLGQRQKISYYRMAFSHCDILLCDEPTGSLDYDSAVELMNELKELSKSKLVVMVSHDHKLVESYSDEIYYISDGEIDKHIVKNKCIKEEKEMNLTYRYPFSSIRLSLYNLLSHKKHSISIILGLFMTMLCVMLTLTLSANLKHQIYDYIYSIVPSSAISFKMKDGTHIVNKITDNIKKIDGIERCHLFLNNYEMLGGGFSNDRYKESETLFIGDDSLPYEHLSLIEGRYPMDDNEIVLSKNYAKQLSDDIDKLLNKTFYIWYKRELKVLKVEFKIVGIADDESYVNTIYQRENAYISMLKDYQYNDYNADMGIIYVDSMVDRNEIYDKLKNQFKECEFLKVGESTYNNVKKIVDRIEIILICFTFLSILSSMILVGEVIFLSVMKSKKDYMIMKCFGAKTFHIIKIVLGESAILFTISSLYSLCAYYGIIGIFNRFLSQSLLNNKMLFCADYTAVFRSLFIIFIICFVSILPSIVYVINNINGSSLKE